MRENKEKIESLKSDANEAKYRLMSIQDKLLNLGETKEAEALAKIIIKLEVWQNR